MEQNERQLELVVDEAGPPVAKEEEESRVRLRLLSQTVDGRGEPPCLGNGAPRSAISAYTRGCKPNHRAYAPARLTRHSVPMKVSVAVGGESPSARPVQDSSLGKGAGSSTHARILNIDLKGSAAKIGPRVPESGTAQEPATCRNADRDEADEAVVHLQDTADQEVERHDPGPPAQPVDGSKLGAHSSEQVSPLRPGP